MYWVHTVLGLNRTAAALQLVVAAPLATLAIRSARFCPQLRGDGWAGSAAAPLAAAKGQEAWSDAMTASEQYLAPWS